jgi:hypothetical protein
MSTLRNTGAPAPRGRRIARVVTALGTAVTLAGTAGLTACADAPSAPASPASRPALNVSASGSTTATALRRKVPLARAITRSVTLTNSGGVVSIPEAGFQLNIPRQAYATSSITITVTALAGDMVAYEFGPHGTVFLAPLKATQDLTPTTWSGHTGNTAFGGWGAAYFADASLLDPLARTARVSEYLPVTFASGNRLHFDIQHFSGYMVATGRTVTY